MFPQSWIVFLLYKIYFLSYSIEPIIICLHNKVHLLLVAVCDELLLGIPHQAWWVVGFVLVCLVLAFIIPSFLPPFLLRAVNQNASKDSWIWLWLEINGWHHQNWLRDTWSIDFQLVPVIYFESLLGNNWLTVDLMGFSHYFSLSLS